MIEFRQFNAMWEQTMQEYEHRAGELLEAMRQRHEFDVNEFRAKHATAAPLPRQTPKLLDLRQIERRLAKQGEYIEAQKVKLRADALETAEAERAVAEREQHLLKLEAALMQRQDQEVNALRQRIQTGAEEQRVARQQDLERLLRRYHNIKHELEIQHKAESNRHRKGVASLPGSHASRAGRTGSRRALLSGSVGGGGDGVGRSGSLLRSSAGNSAGSTSRLGSVSARGPPMSRSLQQLTPQTP